MRADIKTAVKIINEVLEPKINPPENGFTGSATENVSPPESQKQGQKENDDEASSSVTSGKSVSVRLPKICIREFDGKIEQWQEF